MVGGSQETGDTGQDWGLNKTDMTMGLNSNDNNGLTNGLNKTADNLEK